MGFFKDIYFMCIYVCVSSYVFVFLCIYDVQQECDPENYAVVSKQHCFGLAGWIKDDEM